MLSLVEEQKYPGADHGDGKDVSPGFVGQFAQPAEKFNRAQGHGEERKEFVLNGFDVLCQRFGPIGPRTRISPADNGNAHHKHHSRPDVADPSRLFAFGFFQKRNHGQANHRHPSDVMVADRFRVGRMRKIVLKLPAENLPASSDRLQRLQHHAARSGDALHCQNC